MGVLARDCAENVLNMHLKAAQANGRIHSPELVLHVTLGLIKHIFSPIHKYLFCW
jgi:ATP/ADP translocase